MISVHLFINSSSSLLWTAECRSDNGVEAYVFCWLSLFLSKFSNCAFRWKGENGFSIYASAPASSPLILLSVSVLAVSRMTGTWEILMLLLIFPQSSNPSISSIITSLMMRSMLFFSRICNASSPLEAEMTKYSSDRILERKSRISGLSSTTIMAYCFFNGSPGRVLSSSFSSMLFSGIIVSSTRLATCGKAVMAACLGKYTEIETPFSPPSLSLTSIFPFINWTSERVMWSPIPMPSLFISLLFLTW